MKRRVVVMGASGTVGREVMHALSAHPELFEPLAALRSPKSNEGLPSILFDLHDVESMRAALHGVDAIFSMTPLIEDQVSLSQRVLDIALDAGVRQIVRLSSRSATWDLESELRAWHRAIDADIAARAPLYTILRPCSFMQNFLTHQAQGIREKGILALPLGDARLPYIDARDIADVALSALVDPARHQGRTYTLTGSEALDLSSVAVALGKAREKPVRYIAVDEERSEAAMRAGAMQTWLVDSALRVHARTRAGLEATISPDTEMVLGRAARTIDDYAQDHAELLKPR